MKRKHESNDHEQQLRCGNSGRGGNNNSNVNNNVNGSNNTNGNVQHSSESNNFESHSSTNNSSNNSNNIGNNCNNINNQRTQQKRVCREFVKGLCRRVQCRFPHVLSSDQVIFCHDFQNSTCTRSNCRFLHYTLEEEEYYLRHGEFPTEKSKEFTRHIQDNIPHNCEDNYDYSYDRPLPTLCRHRNCLNERPSRRHSPNLPAHPQHGPNMRISPPLNQSNTTWNDFHNRHNFRFNDHRHHLPPTSEYRNGYNNDFQFGNGYMPSQQTIGNGQTNSFQRSQQDDKTRMQQSHHHDSHECTLRQRSLEEVVNMLRCRIEVAELTVAEVRATNEYLLTQMRLNKIQQQCSQCSSTVVVNPVTVTQTTSQPQTAQVIGAVSMAPVQVQATPIVSIATPQTQIITNNAATPLTIATNTSQGQQLAIAQQNITSLSNTTQPLGGTHAQQILGTSQITLAPAIGNGASMGLTINTSQALAMSNATQPIISYPVMTHSILPH